MSRAETESMLSLRLYVAGRAPRSVNAVANLRSLCERILKGKYELEIVDVAREPHRALEDGIIATPTLVRVRPLPVQTVLGDLSEEVVVLNALGVDSHGA